MSTLSKFRVLPQSLLSEHDFDDYPVWSEHYDYEEIEDIERWGLDRDDVLRLFEENSPKNEHCVYTLLQSDPFPDRMRIFIRATLTTASGRKLKGYVMNEDAYCLAVFFNGAEFLFSRHPIVTSTNLQQEALCAALGEPDAIFPIQYQTDFNRKDGQRIAGEFDCRHGLA